eukprot:12128213-Heterocapsa_arctica.AAC.1
MEISELIRMLLQKSEEWSLPLFIGKGDVSKAFDSIERPYLDNALASRKVPVCLRAATLRELVSASMEIKLQGAVTPPVPLGRGGKQGSSDTPALWNYLLDYVLGPVVREWLTKCF